MTWTIEARWSPYDGDVNLPVFLTAKNLKPFISNDLEVTSSQAARCEILTLRDALVANSATSD